MDQKTIKAERNRLGLTLQEVAEKVGAPYSAVYRWEKGQNKPSARNLKRLQDLFAGKLSENPESNESEVEYLRKRVADLEAMLASQEKTLAVFRTALEKIAK